MELIQQYQRLGLSEALFSRGEAVLAALEDRFKAIDQVAEANQLKVLLAMQEAKLGANHFAATTGYGYDDDGRRSRTSSPPAYPVAPIIPALIIFRTSFLKTLA